MDECFEEGFKLECLEESFKLEFYEGEIRITVEEEFMLHY